MMIEQMNKDDLFEYLQVLARLKEVGYKCDQEIFEALSRFKINSNSKQNSIMYVEAGREHSQVVLFDMHLNIGRNLTVQGVRSSIREQAKSIVKIILSHRPSKLVIDTVGIGQGLFDIIIEESRGKVRITKNGSLTYFDKII